MAIYRDVTTGQLVDAATGQALLEAPTQRFKYIVNSDPGFRIEQTWFPKGFCIGTGTVVLGFSDTHRCEFTEAPRTPEMDHRGPGSVGTLEIGAGRIYSRLANGRLIAIPLDDD